MTIEIHESYREQLMTMFGSTPETATAEQVKIALIGTQGAFTALPKATVRLALKDELKKIGIEIGLAGQMSEASRVSVLITMSSYGLKCARKIYCGDEELLVTAIKAAN